MFKFHPFTLNDELHAEGRRFVCEYQILLSLNYQLWAFSCFKNMLSSIVLHDSLHWINTI